MNNAQARTLIVSLVIVILMVVFPPIIILSSRIRTYGGYGYILAPHFWGTSGNPNPAPDVDLARFVLQCVFVLAITGIVFIALRDKKTPTSNKPASRPKRSAVRHRLRQ